MVILNKSPLKTKGSLILIILTIICIQYLLQKNIIGIYGFQNELINKEILDKLFNFKLLVLKTIAITKHLLIAFMKYPLWIIIIFSFLVTNIFYGKKNIFIKYFFYAFVLNIFFIYAVYLHGSSSEFVLSVTLDRLMFQTSGFYLLMIIFLLNKSKFQNSNF